MWNRGNKSVAYNSQQLTGSWTVNRYKEPKPYEGSDPGSHSQEELPFLSRAVVALSAQRKNQDGIGFGCNAWIPKRRSRDKLRSDESVSVGHLAMA